MERSPYADEYRRKLTTAEKAVEPIPEGATLVRGPGIAEPQGRRERIFTEWTRRRMG